LKFLTHISNSKVEVQNQKPLKHPFFKLTQVAAFQGLQLHFELIFCPLTSPKCEFRKVEKRCFKCFEISTLTFDFEIWVKNFKGQTSKSYMKGQWSNFEVLETPLFQPYASRILD